MSSRTLVLIVLLVSSAFPSSVQQTSAGAAPLKLPLGTIIAWTPDELYVEGKATGRTRPIPEGWAVCDGNNGTPDLRNRFLMGVVAPADAGKTGGDNQMKPDGAHNHGGHTGFAEETGDPKTNGKDGRHTHRHDHTISETRAHDHGGDKRPAYFTVIYLMKMKDL